MHVDTHIGVGVEFILEKFNAQGVTYRSDPFHNTVLNVGLLGWWDYTLSEMTTYINVGSGTSAADATQVGLDSRLYTTSTLFVAKADIRATVKEFYSGHKKVFQFAIGTCTGTLTEVGLSRASNASYFNRQRFKNASGDFIAVQVLSDEGLRVTCNIKVYVEPSLRIYSRIFKIPFYGATAGDITFKNNANSKTRTITLAALKAALWNDPMTSSQDASFYNAAYLDTQGFVGGKYSPEDDCFYIAYGWQSRRDSTNNPVWNELSILSHTLTGGTQAPQILLHQDYDASKHPITTFNLYDETAGTNVSKSMVKAFSHYFYAGSNTFLGPFDCGNSYAVWMQAIKNIVFKPNALTTNPSTTTIITSPSLGNNTTTKKFYYAPGVLSTSDYTVNFVSMSFNGSSAWTGSNIDFFLVEPITISNLQEIEFTGTITWGGYTPT